MLMADRIKELRLAAGLTQEELGVKIGLQKSAIAKYENGRVENIKRSTIQAMADLFQVRPSYILGFEDKEEKKQPPEHNGVPLLGRIAAGTENEIFDDVYDWIPFEPTDGGKYFALRVRGESMTPTLMDGDIIIVRSQSEVRSGDIAVVTINGNEATCKEVQVSGDGLALIGHNTSVYTPHFYSAEDVEHMPIVIRGKVVSMRRDF